MTRLEKAIMTATIFLDTKNPKHIDEDGMPHIVHSLEVMFAVKREFESFQMPVHSLREKPHYTNPTDMPEGYTLEDMLIAAVLHDLVEDTGYSLEHAAEDFGEKVADAIDAVSRRHGDPLCKVANCSEHTKETYKDFIYRAQAHAAGKIIKIADLGCNRRRTGSIPESKAKWRAKLEFKYDTALKVLLMGDTWEQASWQWHSDDKGGHFTIADPNGKKIKVTEEEFKKLTGRV